MVHQIRQGCSVAAAVQKFRARQSRSGGTRFSSQKIPAHRGEKAKRATGPAIRSSWISHDRGAEQQRPKGVAVRWLFPRWPGGVHRAAAKIAKGLTASDPISLGSILRYGIRAAAAKTSVGFFC